MPDETSVMTRAMRALPALNGILGSALRFCGRDPQRTDWKPLLPLRWWIVRSAGDVSLAPKAHYSYHRAAERSIHHRQLSMANHRLSGTGRQLQDCAECNSFWPIIVPPVHHLVSDGRSSLPAGDSVIARLEVFPFANYSAHRCIM